MTSASLNPRLAEPTGLVGRTFPGYIQETDMPSLVRLGVTASSKSAGGPGFIARSRPRDNQMVVGIRMRAASHKQRAPLLDRHVAADQNLYRGLWMGSTSVPRSTCISPFVLLSIILRGGAVPTERQTRGDYRACVQYQDQTSEPLRRCDR